MVIKRGDIFYADLNPSFGSEQGGIRPVLVVQNNIGNIHSPTIVVLPITSMVNKKIHWVCRKHDGDSTKCLSKSIAEETFYQAFIRLHNKLLHHYRSILIPIQQMLQELKWKKYGGNIRVMDIHKEIAKLREQNHVIARLRTKGFMDEGKYQEQSKELNNKIRKLQAELKKITRSDDEDDVLEQLDMLIDYFEKRDRMMVSFEPETFDMMVDKITANQNELTFHLLGGIKLKEKM